MCFVRVHMCLTDGQKILWTVTEFLPADPTTFELSFTDGEGRRDRGSSSRDRDEGGGSMYEVRMCVCVCVV